MELTLIIIVLFAGLTAGANLPNTQSRTETLPNSVFPASGRAAVPKGVALLPAQLNFRGKGGYADFLSKLSGPQGRQPMYKIIRQTIPIWVLLGLIVFWSGSPAAQYKVPPPDLANAGHDSEFEKTKDFINKTQSKINRVRGETEARAKEIEALATRVGDIIAAMSSQGEDNTNLISEISVLNELLTIERQTTSGLRSDIAGLNKAIEVREAAHKAAEAALSNRYREDMEAAAKREARLARDVVRAQDITAAAQRNLSATENKLGSALATIAGHAQTNRVLVSDIIAMRKEMARLKSEILLVKKRRMTPLPRRQVPGTQRPNPD